MASQATRQVYVRVKPLPRTIQDTKEVLKALQKYGEVLTFRNLRVCGVELDCRYGH
jgi:hypothetical protein